jgi:hypothetical protein
MNVNTAMTTTPDNLNLSLVGRVMIHDEQGNLLMERKNAIHPQNMALVVARALAREDNGYVLNLVFGNGGTFYNTSNVLVYKSPNTIGSNATLYNQTYTVQVDETTSGTPTTNSVVALPSPAPSLTALVVVTAQLSALEPLGQAVADNLTTNPEAAFVFDEIGLQSSDGLLLSHLVFSPIEKTANRAWLITYTITISAS